MKADTYIEFQKINARLDDLTKAVDALLDQGMDREAAKALTEDVKKQTKRMKKAFPKSTVHP